MTKTKFRSYAVLAVAAAALSLAACADADAHSAAANAAAETELASDVVVLTLADTLLSGALPATGTAAPIREATLSTKLMASVLAVDVVEGNRVRSGQSLLRLDANDLTAKREQVMANQAAARAMHAQASAQAARVRALFADDAAPKAMLDAAEAGLVQAESGLRAAEAAARELDAVAAYANITAPFDGVVTKRFVDPGAFAAPGAPLLSLQDASTLRVTVHVAPAAARAVRAGDTVPVTIEGQSDVARVEGVVPATGGLYAVNALVRNVDGRHLAGSAATMALPADARRVLTVPSEALIREGDLVGVVLRTTSGDVRRWIRTGAAVNGLVEVTAGLRAGDQVVIRTPAGVE